MLLCGLRMTSCERWRVIQMTEDHQLVMTRSELIEERQQLLAKLYTLDLMLDVPAITGETVEWGGKVARLSRLPLLMLEVLAGNAGALVARTTIIRICWPADPFVTDDTYRQAIYRLRTELRDHDMAGLAARIKTRPSGLILHISGQI
jgi:DNA-binding response OmpR family regulator